MDLFVLNGNPMIVQRTRCQRSHATKKLVRCYNWGYCKQLLKLHDKRIYCDGTDAAFVEDRIRLQLDKPKSKQL